VILTTHPLLVPRLRKSRSYTSCHPNAPIWSVTGPLYLFLPHINKRNYTNHILYYNKFKTLEVECVCSVAVTNSPTPLTDSPYAVLFTAPLKCPGFGYGAKGSRTSSRDSLSLRKSLLIYCAITKHLSL
jgi:hypothetical protein